MAKNKKEFREELTAQFLELLKRDDLSWVKEWSGMETMPINGLSHKQYTGLNQLKLLVTMMQRDYSDPRFMTYNQAHKIKREDKRGMCSVMKDSRGVQVEYWFMNDLKKAFGQKGKFLSFQEAQKLIDDGLRKPEDFQLTARYYTVFNAAQIDGIPDLKLDKPVHSAVHRDQIVDQISASMHVPIEYNDGDRCFYRPSEDRIFLPRPEYFHTQYAFMSTALHELGHSTGASTRLNRDMGHFFGSKEYAFEELVAEMASCFISSEVRHPDEDDSEYWNFHIKNHAGYVKSWAEILESDSNALPKALKLAEQAADYLEVHAGILTQEEYDRRYSAPHTLTINQNNEIQEAPEAVPSLEPVLA